MASDKTDDELNHDRDNDLTLKLSLTSDGDDHSDAGKSTGSSCRLSSPHHSDHEELSTLPDKKRGRKKRLSETNDGPSGTMAMKASGGSKVQHFPLSERQQLALLMKEGALESPKSPSQFPQLLGSASRGKLSRIHRRNEKGETLLHVAAKRGDYLKCRSLIRQGADVNCKDNAGWTPLHEACSFGSYETVKVLVHRGANVDVCGDGNETPLHDAAQSGNEKLVKLLLKHGADVFKVNSEGQTAADLCQSAAVTELLKAKMSAEPITYSDLSASSLEDASEDEPSCSMRNRSGPGTGSFNSPIASPGSTDVKRGFDLDSPLISDDDSHTSRIHPLAVAKERTPDVASSKSLFSSVDKKSGVGIQASSAKSEKPFSPGTVSRSPEYGKQSKGEKQTVSGVSKDSNLVSDEKERDYEKVKAKPTSSNESRPAIDKKPIQDIHRSVGTPASAASPAVPSRTSLSSKPTRKELDVSIKPSIKQPCLQQPAAASTGISSPTSSSGAVKLKKPSDNWLNKVVPSSASICTGSAEGSRQSKQPPKSTTNLEQSKHSVPATGSRHSASTLFKGTVPVLPSASSERLSAPHPPHAKIVAAESDHRDGGGKPKDERLSKSSSNSALNNVSCITSTAFSAETPQKPTASLAKLDASQTTPQQRPPASTSQASVFAPALPTASNTANLSSSTSSSLTPTGIAQTAYSEDRKRLKVPFKTRLESASTSQDSAAGDTRRRRDLLVPQNAAEDKPKPKKVKKRRADDVYEFHSSASEDELLGSPPAPKFVSTSELQPAKSFQSATAASTNTLRRTAKYGGSESNIQMQTKPEPPPSVEPGEAKHSHVFEKQTPCIPVSESAQGRVVKDRPLSSSDPSLPSVHITECKATTSMLQPVQLSSSNKSSATAKIEKTVGDVSSLPYNSDKSAARSSKEKTSATSIRPRSSTADLTTSADKALSAETSHNSVRRSSEVVNAPTAAAQAKRLKAGSDAPATTGTVELCFGRTSAVSLPPPAPPDSSISISVGDDSMDADGARSTPSSVHSDISLKVPPLRIVLPAPTSRSGSSGGDSDPQPPPSTQPSRPVSKPAKPTLPYVARNQDGEGPMDVDREDRESASECAFDALSKTKGGDDILGSASVHADSPTPSCPANGHNQRVTRSQVRLHGGQLETKSDIGSAVSAVVGAVATSGKASVKVPRKRNNFRSKEPEMSGVEPTYSSNSAGWMSTSNSSAVVASRAANNGTRSLSVAIAAKNSYEGFRQLRQAIESKWTLTTPETIHYRQPQNWDKYYLTKKSYLLHGRPENSSAVAQVPSSVLPECLVDISKTHEESRHTLRQQHQVERERLIMACEKEVLRIHNRCSRAASNSFELPFNCMRVLTDAEIYNPLELDKPPVLDVTARERFNPKMMQSWIQEVQDRFLKQKGNLIRRQTMESDSLFAVQKMDMDAVVRRLTISGVCNLQGIPETDTVPRVIVNEDFLLLPA